MRINTNISSLTAQRSLSTTTKAFTRALERLSSGKRINSARDDAAGMAIASGLEAQVRGLNRSILNTNEAQGFLQSAEGAISVQTELVQRMRELALQSANGTLSSKDRSNLNLEFQQLVSEFDRIASQTKFNGISLLDGSFGTRSLQVGTRKGETIDFSIRSTRREAVLPLGEDSSSSTGTATFTQASQTPMDDYPQGVAVGDVNGDGQADLANVGYGGAVTIRFGGGDGTFKAPQTIDLRTTAGSGTYSKIEMADIFGDGIKHLIVANTADDTISILLNDGTGVFSVGTTISLNGGNGPWGLTVGDFNNDQVDDFVVQSNDGNNGVFISLRDGNFDNISTIRTAGHWGAPPVTGDFNHDGNLDIGFYGNDNEMDIQLGNGDGTFNTSDPLANPSPGIGFSYVVSTDYNGDGILDLIATDLLSKYIYIFAGDDTAHFSLENTIDMGSSDVHNLQAADVNGDHKIDFMVSNDKFIFTYLGDGTGSFTKTSTTQTSGSDWSNDFELADLNGDGFLDLIRGDSGGAQVQAFLQNKQSSSSGQINLSIETQSDAQDLLDLLDDGLSYLNTERSNLGAIQSRLEFALNNSQFMSENLSQAKSNLLDTDVAAETSELVRNQILQQAGVSVLGQANLSTQLVMQLLRF